MTPVTIPVPEPILAFVLLALHTPLPVEIPSVVDAPMQTLIVPVIAGGNGFTVTALVIRQPVGKV